MPMFWEAVKDMPDIERRMKNCDFPTPDFQDGDYEACERMNSLCHEAIRLHKGLPSIIDRAEYTEPFFIVLDYLRGAAWRVKEEKDVLSRQAQSR